MKKLIGKGNVVEYGCIDEPIEWNYRDFILRDFFNREIKGLRKKLAYHQFNYIGVIAGEYAMGFALVDLGFIKNAFGFLYRLGDGMILESDEKCSGFSGKMVFPRNPDAYAAGYCGSRVAVVIEKDHERGVLSFSCAFGKRLEVKGLFPYSMDSHQPLRVLNPNDPNRFTFTEKCAPLRAEVFEMTLDGEALLFESDDVTAIYDWTGGYLRRETNWYWTAFGTVMPDGTELGANLAAFVNETYFSENAFWVDGRRTRVPRVLYRFDPLDPYQRWHICDEAGIVDMTFTPAGERSDKINAGPLFKTMFRQFLGVFEGSFRPEDGGRIEFKDVKGFCEIHRSVW